MKSTVYFWQGFACGRQFQNFPPLHLVITITHGNLPLMENVSYTTFSQVMYEIYILGMYKALYIPVRTVPCTSM